MKKRDKRASILLENIVFIILNLIFLTMLVVFIARQGSGTILLEENYAKQIALIFDSAEENMTIFLHFGKGIEEVEDNFGEGYFTKDNLREKIITLQDNIVRVKLDKDTGYTYSFFNKNISSSNLVMLINEDMGGIYFLF